MLSQALKQRLGVKLLHDQEGAVAVELAFALPVVIMLLVGAFELGGVMITETLMEGAVRQASRVGMTNYKEGNLSREQTILKILDEDTLGFVDINKAVVTQLVYSNFSDIGKPEPLTVDVNGNGKYDEADGDEYTDINGNAQWDEDMGKAGLGGAGDVVVYTVKYSYPSLTGILSPLFGNDGTLTLTASTAIRNEPFGSGGLSGGGGGGGSGG